jgi:hypothetical protein
MKNKFLIGGSIIAVAVLVLAGLSPVVGYNSANSSVRDYPLFSVRMKRAIDKDSDGLNRNYLGQGRVLSITLPTRERGISAIQKLIEEINEMGEKTHEKVHQMIINRLRMENITAIREVINDDPTLDFQCRTSHIPCTINAWWAPGCLIKGILTFILDILEYIIITILICTVSGEWCE